MERKLELQRKSCAAQVVTLDGRPRELVGTGAVAAKVLPQSELKQIVKRIRERERNARPLRIASFDC